ncbi:MAG: hypothetical protein QOG81_1993, partial [Gaiellaceae bacterium]|nr:hypothetical protein [Gaiellaceae bacterium]
MSEPPPESIVKAHPRVRGGLAVRGMSLVAGLFLFALAI